MFTLFLTPPRFRDVVFEVTSVDVGKFEVSGGFLGRQIEKVELVFQVRGAGNVIVCVEVRSIILLGT